MAEPGSDLDLAQKALVTEGRGQLGPQHLEGDPAVVPDVVREVHRRHAPGADLALDRVAAGQGRRQGARHVIHGACKMAPAHGGREWRAPVAHAGESAPAGRLAAWSHPVQITAQPSISRCATSL